MIPKCWTCHWYEYVQTFDGRGICRLNPPVVIPLLGNTPTSDTVFPLVGKDDWCGKWRKRIEVGG